MVRKKKRNTLAWKIKGIVKNYLLLDALFLVYAIFDKLLTKNNTILFVFTKDEKFVDNSMYLFKYMHEKNNEDIQLFIYNKVLYEQLKKEYPDKLLYAYSKKGFLAFLKSKTVILSTGLDKLLFNPYYLNPKQKTIIQLWHGSLFKRLGFQVADWNKKKNKKELQRFSKFIACSTLEQFMIASCFDMNVDDIWITDYPRNDNLLEPTKDLTQEFPYLKHKTILYAPTWREEGRDTKFFPFEDVDLLEIQKFLELNDAYLLIRGHKEEVDRINDTYNLSLGETNRIIPADQSVFPKGDELLPFVDILITDYSGIYNDFLLLNRPVIFIPYDIEDYSTYRGVLFDYDKFTAGPKVYKQKELLLNLKCYLDQPDKDIELRKRLMSVFHDSTISKASQAIYSKIKEI